MKNILKIVFLGVLGFGLLTYLTAEEPVKNLKGTSGYNLDGVPNNLELVGSEKIYKKSEVFKSGTKSLLIVGNHDSLIIVKDLKKYVDVNIPYIMVANISKAPWFIKKWVVPSKLEEINKGTNSQMIFDYDGSMVASLGLDDTTKTKFFAYIINENGSIDNVYVGNVKEDAMDGTMNEEEIKEALKPIAKFL